MKDKEDNTTIIVIVLVGIVLLIFGTFFGHRGGSGGPSGGSSGNSAGYFVTPHQLDQLEQNVKTWQHNVDRRDDFRARHNLEER